MSVRYAGMHSRRCPGAQVPRCLGALVALGTDPYGAIPRHTGLTVIDHTDRQADRLAGRQTGRIPL